eukprot:GHVU01176018.1.p2 GENE.GHVU01176018.1~~GHVU01176018.1.p2  ORF type:complete len:121 (-),score=1.78 GHVU01176018.1:167-529(-)
MCAAQHMHACMHAYVFICLFSHLALYSFPHLFFYCFVAGSDKMVSASCLDRCKTATAITNQQSSLSLLSISPCLHAFMPPCLHASMPCTPNDDVNGAAKTQRRSRRSAVTGRSSATAQQR